MNQTAKKTRFLVYNALFIALIAVMQITGLGLIRLGVINITFYCTVIAVGTLFLGLKSGLVQGFAFGSISLYSALTAPSGLVAPILGESWLLVVLMCYIPRLLVPVAVHLGYKLIMKLSNQDKLALALGSAAGSLTNSVLYLGILMLCYIPLFAQYPAVPATVGGVVLYGSIPEFIAAGIIAPPLVMALRKIRR